MERAMLRLELLKLCHRKDHTDELIMKSVSVLEKFVLETEEKSQAAKPSQVKTVKDNKNVENPFK